jgi:hypothetical protein
VIKMLLREHRELAPRNNSATCPQKKLKLCCGASFLPQSKHNPKILLVTKMALGRMKLKGV